MSAAVQKLGLALSGGGFRASLYHLGLVRFLRDACILPQVSHITSVSGGSILAAHLALNWGRYNGSPSDFDAAASEFLALVRLDVRNRIVRRFPLTLPLRWPCRLLGRSNRWLSRTGLLEYHYEKYLYGHTNLSELPEKPQLHILATNLSEGCLCSFNRNGLLMERRQPGGTVRIERIQIGLATVAMAVTASSAFPGFFPPLELTGADVGATRGEFGRQSYTDGGVFDNLGVRMFRSLELADSSLSREDFVDFAATVDVLRQASRSSDETPLRRLGEILVEARSRPDALLLSNGLTSRPDLPPLSDASNGDGEELLLAGLRDLLRSYEFQREPLFARLKPTDPEAEALLRDSSVRCRVLKPDDQLRLNRNLLEAVFRQTTGHACFRRLNSGLDGVLVSDVGQPIQVKSHSGGLIRTAIRATDILMDRVWQLEKETFRDTPGFVFAPVTEVVDPAEDPTALHPEIQRQAANTRTDIDRFSMLEISSLVRHGYCVGRKACRTRPDLFGSKLPGNAPWDPVPDQRGAAPSVLVSTPSVPARRRKGEPSAATVDAEKLQASAVRRIWSTLLDYRDWISYVYVPILVPILVLLPYVVVKSYERSHRISQLVDSLSQGSRDLEIMTRLLDGPMTPWAGEAAEEVRALEEPDFRRFEILQDSRILDMRAWNPDAPGKNNSGALVYGYRRLKVLKRPESGGSNIFRVSMLTESPTASVRCPPQRLKPKLSMSNVEGVRPGDRKCHWQMSADFSKVPAGHMVDLIYEHYSHGEFLQPGNGSTTLAFVVEADKAEVIRWFLMPAGKEYRSFRIVRYKTGKPEEVEPVQIVTEYLAEDFTILAYKLMSVKAGYTYEITWYYK